MILSMKERHTFGGILFYNLCILSRRKIVLGRLEDKRTSTKGANMNYQLPILFNEDRARKVDSLASLSISSSQKIRVHALWVTGGTVSFMLSYE